MIRIRIISRYNYFITSKKRLFWQKNFSRQYLERANFEYYGFWVLRILSHTEKAPDIGEILLFTMRNLQWKYYSPWTFSVYSGVYTGITNTIFVVVNIEILMIYHCLTKGRKKRVIFHLPGAHLPEAICIICPKGLYRLPERLQTCIHHTEVGKQSVLTENKFHFCLDQCIVSSFILY